MDEEIKGLKSVLRSLAEKERGRAGAHLTAEQLIAYNSDELAPTEAHSAQRHLVACRECASLLLDLAAFGTEEVDEADLPSQSDIEAALARLQASLPEAPHSPPRPTPPAPSFINRLGGLLFPQRLAYALVALLFVVSLSLILWITSLNRENRELVSQLSQRQDVPVGEDADAQKALAEAQREIRETQRQRDEERARAEQIEERANRLEAQVAESQRETSRPPSRERNPQTRAQPNAPVLVLSLGNVREQDNKPKVLYLPPATALFTLAIQNDAQGANYGEFELEITDLRGATVLRQRGLRSVPQGSPLTIALPGSALPAGLYHVEVYGISKGSRTSIGKAQVAITNK